jgi:Family of unknown function (DUF6161)
MTIKFTYAGTAMTFQSKKELHVWCDWHIERLGGVAVNSNNDAIGASIFQSLKSGKSMDQAASEFRYTLPPVRDEASGRYLYMLQKNSPETFKGIMKYWHEFGRVEVPLNRNAPPDQIIAAATFIASRASHADIDSASLVDLISEQRVARDELLATRKTYEELMRLRAPADYWQSKSLDHHRSEEEYLNSTIKAAIVFVVLSVFLPILFITNGYQWIVARVGEGRISENIAASVSLASYVLLGLYVLLVTTGLWGLRVLVKLYLSEHHLRADATERLTMTMTYLALTEKGAATDVDRTIILSALFRPSQDGVVKDEGIDPSIPHLLSRALARP